MDQGLAQHRLPSVQDALQLSQDKERDVACSPKDKTRSGRFLFLSAIFFSDFLLVSWALPPKEHVGWRCSSIDVWCGNEARHLEERLRAHLHTPAHTALCLSSPPTPTQQNKRKVPAFRSKLSSIILPSSPLPAIGQIALSHLSAGDSPQEGDTRNPQCQHQRQHQCRRRRMRPRKWR